MALMTADSYSGILGLGTVFAVLLIWFSRSVARLKRFFLATTIMLLSGKILRLFSFFMGDKSKGISEFQSLLVYSKIIWAAIALFAIITAILFLQTANSRQDFTSCRSYYNRLYICCLHYCNAFCRILFQCN